MTKRLTIPHADIRKTAVSKTVKIQTLTLTGI